MTVSQGSPLDARMVGGSIDRSGLVDRLTELVRTESENPPGHEQAIGNVVEAMCRDLGLDVSLVEAVPGRPNVIARVTGGPGRKLVYCTHIDVVPAGDKGLWDVDPYAAEIVDGRLYGRGSCDAKGGLAAALEAVRVLDRLGSPLKGTLELHFVADEETMGLKGAGHLLEKGLLRCDAAMIGEPTSLRVVTAQRGACWLRVTTRGLATHGSAPERGRSAIKHMAEIALRLEETLPDVEHEILGGPSINVGVIRGGEKVNIVPAACVCEVDRRTLPGESADDVVAQIYAAVELAKSRFPDIEAVVDVALAGDPFVTPRDARIVRDVSAAVEGATGRPAELLGFRGASDARFFADAGAEVIVCGPGDIKLAHTAGESVDIDEVERAAVAYALAFDRSLSEVPEDG